MSISPLEAFTGQGVGPVFSLTGGGNRSGSGIIAVFIKNGQYPIWIRKLLTGMASPCQIGYALPFLTYTGQESHVESYFRAGNSQPGADYRY
jgi:hypothetical protein